MKGLLFVYALTYGGAIVSLFRPWYGLLIYITFAILRPEALWHWSVPRGDYSLIIAITFLIGWALSGFGSWRIGKATPVLCCLLLFWVYLFVQIALSPTPDRTTTSVIQLSKTFLPVVAGLTMLNSAQRLKQLGWTLVLAQGYLAFEFNLMYYQNPMFNSEEWGFAGSDNNGIAISLCTTVGMAFFLGLGASKWWQSLLAFAAAGFMTHTVLFSMSRGGMLALVITGIVSFYLIPKKPKHYLLFALGVTVALQLAGPSVTKEFTTAFASEEERDASAASRVDHWKACLSSMASRPLGVGMDQWGNVAPSYGLPQGMEAHNTWLQLGAELGIPGLLLILGFYGFGVMRLLPLTRSRANVPDEFITAAARMVVASFIGFFISSSFVTVEGQETSYYMMLFGAGALRLASTRHATAYTSHLSQLGMESWYPPSHGAFGFHSNHQ